MLAISRANVNSPCRSGISFHTESTHRSASMTFLNWQQRLSHILYRGCSILYDDRCAVHNSGGMVRTGCAARFILQHNSPLSPSSQPIHSKKNTKKTRTALCTEKISRLRIKTSTGIYFTETWVTWVQTFFMNVEYSVS